ncbi:MAG: methyltransferase C-terminal domain-containing protein, partial [Dehalococcoidia bacterium]
IYHEHVSYWALGPMTRLFAAHGLHVTHVERLPIHHGQLRVFVQRQGEGAVDASVEETLEAERLLGIGEIETYRLFAEQARRIKADLCRTLTDLRGQGKRVVGYGAPAKGNTLLNFLEIGPDTIDYIADRSPLKQGLVTPGSHIPVVPPERLLAEQPEYVLLLAWNFAEEIMRQLASYSERGGHFILPVPEVRIV